MVELLNSHGKRTRKTAIFSWLLNCTIAHLTKKRMTHESNPKWVYDSKHNMKVDIDREAWDGSMIEKTIFLQ